MKILIAGGCGYVGTALVKKLLEKNYNIKIIDLLWFDNHHPENNIITKKNIFELKVNDLKNYDQVIFVAGLSNDPMAEYSPNYNFIYNAAAPAYLCYIAKEAKVKRFIYASSCSVYGYTINKLYDETSLTSCKYPYGISKLQGEKAVLQMQDNNFSVIILRKGTICGYSKRMRLDLVINTMFKNAIEKHTLTINNANIWRPILSIKDAIRAYILAIKSNYNTSGIFNISSGNYTIGEIGNIVKTILEKKINKNIELNILKKSDYRNYKVTNKKAENFLNFKAKDTIKNIIYDLIENQNYFKDFDNPKYYNIKIFKSLNLKKNF